MAWYFKGYVVGGELRTALALGDHPRGAPRDCWTSWTWTRPTRAPTPRARAGRAGSPKSPALPKAGCSSRHLNADQQGDDRRAELDVSGG